MNSTTSPTLPPDTVAAVACDTLSATPAPSPFASSETLVMRDLAVIAADIRLQREKTAESFYQIGRLLIEAKQQLPQKQSWLTWLENNVGLSVRTAERYMSLARGYSDSTALSILGETKALALLAIPESERESFIAEKHEIDREIGTIQELPTRKVQRLVRLFNCSDAASETIRGSQRKGASCCEIDPDGLKCLRPYSRVTSPASPTKLFQDSLEKACNSLEKVNRFLQTQTDSDSFAKCHDRLQTLTQAVHTFICLTASSEESHA